MTPLHRCRRQQTKRITDEANPGQQMSGVTDEEGKSLTTESTKDTKRSQVPLVPYFGLHPSVATALRKRTEGSTAPQRCEFRVSSVTSVTCGKIPSLKHA